MPGVKGCLVVKPRPLVGWREEVMIVTPWCGTDSASCPRRVLNLERCSKQMFIRFNIFLANTCWQTQTFRNLAWDYTAWCTHGFPL